MSTADPNVDASIVLNVLGLRDLATYGFRSWLLQDYQRPYEIVLNLFAPCRNLFDPLVDGKNPNAIISVYEYPTPRFFNISAANNLGLHKSRGKYVMFANADIIYPPWYLTRALGELNRREIGYAVASRSNMTKPQTDKIHAKPPMQYTRDNGFGHLMGSEWEEGVMRLVALTPWMVRRDLAMAVGGFDPKILFAEDRDLDYRLLHYLRRKNLQHAMIGLTDLWGYHQWHTSTGLVNTMHTAKAIMEPRARRMEADFNSNEDILPTKLDDLDALNRDMAETEPPPIGNQYRKDWRGKIRRRAKRVWSALRDI